MKSLFHEPWSDTPKPHITTFTCQLERRQAECEDNIVIIIDANEVDHFFDQMYLYDIFESKLLDNWEYGTDKDWVSTKKTLSHSTTKSSARLTAKSHTHLTAAAPFCMRHWRHL